MKITRFICLLVILPIIVLAVTVHFNVIGSYGVPFFSVAYCGVVVPVVKITENLQMRKFAISLFKELFDRLKIMTSSK
jgi:hypothetical protein